METKWTASQQQAIDHRGSSLLVSAAAGSGKTAVLVERVIRQIVEEGVAVNRFLLVTFTSAAAIEMRGKISAALKKELPRNPNLKKQLYLLASANITTVHSFCLSLVREFAHNLDLRGDFRVGDSKEVDLICEEALEYAIEEAFMKPEFCAMADCLFLKEREMRECFLRFYGVMQSQPFPRAFLADILADYEQPLPVLEGKWGEVILRSSLGLLNHCQTLLSSALDLLEDCLPVHEKYAPAFMQDRKNVIELKEALQGRDYDKACQLLASWPMVKLGAVRGFEDKEFLEKLKDMRSEYKTLIEKLSFFTQDQLGVFEDLNLLRPHIKAFCDFMLTFDGEFARQKRRKNLLDFSDLEHFAISLLSENGERSPLAQSISTRFHEIMIDEYQDSNAVQDFIFSALGCNNLFMVGDVKQSIYRFRLAEPKIFLDKYLSFPHKDKAAEGEPCKIVLSKNFRSRGQVLDSCNYLFGQIMTPELGDIDYGPDEALYLGADYPAGTGHETKLCLLDISTMSEEDEEGLGKTALEAEYVAGEIAQMLHDAYPVFDRDVGGNRPARPSDFAILMRSGGNKAGIFLRALKKRGIRCSAEQSARLMEATEIKAVLAFLAVLDNPRQDVPLAAVLRSRLFDFSDDFLAEIKLESPKTTLFEAVQAKAATGESQTTGFLAMFDALQLLSMDKDVYTLLWAIYDRSNALGLYGAMEGGKIRQSNLLLFSQRVRAFEENGFRGLFAFQRLIDRMVEKGEDFVIKTSEAEEDSVKIMTMHKSKGLEFPIVFLCDMTKRFNKMDLREGAVFHGHYGLGSKVYDGAVQYSTLPRDVIAKATEGENLSEELRVLYVAMTRAKEKLFIIFPMKNIEKTLGKWGTAVESGGLTPFGLRLRQSWDFWILAPLLSHPAAKHLRELGGLNTLPINLDAPDSFSFSVVVTKDKMEQAEQQTDVERALALTASPFPVYAAPSQIPSKIAVTAIDSIASPKLGHIHLRKPLFIEEATQLSPTDKGIANHIFLQFANFSLCDTQSGIEGEIARLVENRSITRQQGEAVLTAAILQFFHSPVYQRMKNATWIKREFKFSILLPSQTLLGVAGGDMMVQGVMDCIFEDEKGLVIVDYKTDGVSRESLGQRMEEYTQQMRLYKEAASLIFEQKCEEAWLYFLNLGESVSL